eukprot:Nk52_evm26s218 gene=Nk52_evmTU26s218
MLERATAKESMNQKELALYQKIHALLGDESVAALKIELARKMPADTLQYLALTGLSKEDLLRVIIQGNGGDDANQQSPVSLLIANDQKVDQVVPTIRDMFGMFQSQPNDGQLEEYLYEIKQGSQMLAKCMFETFGYPRTSASARYEVNSEFEAKGKFEQAFFELRKQTQEFLRRTYLQEFNKAPNSIRDESGEVKSDVQTEISNMVKAVGDGIIANTGEPPKMFEILQASFQNTFKHNLLRALDSAFETGSSYGHPEIKIDKLSTSLASVGKFVRISLITTYHDLIGPLQASVKKRENLQTQEGNQPKVEFLEEIFVRAKLNTRVLDLPVDPRVDPSSPSADTTTRDFIFEYFETQIIERTRRVVDTVKATIQLPPEQNQRKIPDGVADLFVAQQKQGQEGVLPGSEEAIRLKEDIDQVQEHVNDKRTSASRYAVAELLEVIYPENPQLVRQLSEAISSLTPEARVALKATSLIFAPEEVEGEGAFNTKYNEVIQKPQENPDEFVKDEIANVALDIKRGALSFVGKQLQDDHLKRMQAAMEQEEQENQQSSNAPENQPSNQEGSSPDGVKIENREDEGHIEHGDEEGGYKSNTERQEEEQVSRGRK